MGSLLGSAKANIKPPVWYRVLGTPRHTHTHTPRCPSSSSPSCGSRSRLIVRGQASELRLLDFVAETVVAWAWEGVDVRGAELLSGEHSLPGPCGAKCPPQLG